MRVIGCTDNRYWSDPTLMLLLVLDQISQMPDTETTSGKYDAMMSYVKGFFKASKVCEENSTWYSE